MPGPLRRLSERRRKEGIAFAKQRFAWHITQGKTGASAKKAAMEDTKQKFVLEWYLLMPIIEVILKLLLQAWLTK